MLALMGEACVRLPCECQGDSGEQGPSVLGDIGTVIIASHIHLY